mmetsp:Transcript_63363/g.138183  ORF Transcript_63363/g.138183 Transcript_63363/m.138183 type:complete len:208 (+) Transcript_63363:612-1235(+)
MESTGAVITGTTTIDIIARKTQETVTASATMTATETVIVVVTRIEMTGTERSRGKHHHRLRWQVLSACQPLTPLHMPYPKLPRHQRLRVCLGLLERSSLQRLLGQRRFVSQSWLLIRRRPSRLLLSCQCPSLCGKSGTLWSETSQSFLTLMGTVMNCRRAITAEDLMTGRRRQTKLQLLLCRRRWRRNKQRWRQRQKMPCRRTSLLK